MIHRDAHPSNMLFDGGELTGFLDFEMVTRGLRVFDVCYCGSALLAGGFDEVEKRKQWPELFHSLLQTAYPKLVVRW
jgi:Ser/Thr protein kinase RdoA (MazF antagonist)